MMRPRTLRRLEGLITLFGTAAILAATGWCVFSWLRPLPPWRAPALDLEVKPVEALPRTVPSLDELAVIWKRDLRQPPFDPPPKPVAVAPPPSLDLRLVATAVEGERAFAFFESGKTGARMRQPGERIDGFDVLRIERGLAVLRNGERQYELKVPWYDRLAAAGRSP